MENKPADSHVARTDQDIFGKIFRRNMPYGNVEDHGTMFVGFSAEQVRLSRMLYSMAGAVDGTRDKGSFFNHFRSKEEFAHEAVEAYFASWMERAQVILRRDDLSATQKLQMMLRISTGKTDGCYHGCMIGNLSLEMANQSESLRKLLAKILGDWTQAFEQVIREGQSAGAFDPSLAADKTARFIVNLFQGAALRSKVERSDRATDEFVDIVLTTLAAQ